MVKVKLSGPEGSSPPAAKFPLRCSEHGTSTHTAPLLFTLVMG